LEERGWELKRVSQSVYKLNWVANPIREAWGKNSNTEPDKAERLDMIGLGAGHV
jgi:hypothetical protein